MKKLAKAAVSIILSLALLFLLLKDIDLGLVKDLFSEISLFTILLGFVIYFMLNLFRALRFQALLPEIRFKTILSITLVHNFFNNLLPFRSGELSYIYLVNKQRSLSHGLSSLAFVRVMDVVSISLFFSISLFSSKANADIFHKYSFLGVLLSLGIITAYYLFQYLPLNNIPRLSKIQKILRSYSWKKSLVVFFYSTLVWVLSFLLYYIVIRDLSIPLPFFAIVLPASLLIFSTILPITGFAGFGTMESAWTIGMLYLGVSKEIGVSSGLIIHFLRIMYLLILGGTGFLLAPKHEAQRVYKET